ncbi:ATP-dependent nuclease [Clostridium perfringens]
MKIAWVRIEGFRNYDNETINLEDKTLIIGSNDVGKTNLIYALRILFDKSISDSDLELSDSDYNAYVKAKQIIITACITNIEEDCLKSTFSGDIKEGTTYVQYRNEKDGEYSIYSGPSEDLLELKTGRFYLKRLNLEYVNSNRNLFNFISKEKKELLKKTKELLDESKQKEDEDSINKLQKDLGNMNTRIDNLNYISNSLNSVNRELGELSINNEGQTIKFTTDNNNVDDLLENLELSYNMSDGALKIGGDGRNNQIYLATWVARQKLNQTQERITMFAIEEPEAHLHPHQQRKLSKYLANSFEQQVLITTHSPQIASEFRPDRIVRLYQKNKITKVAQGGCSKKLQLSFNDFGYRIDAISSEIFFSNAVFLVEGPSEKLFFTALAKGIGIDLDRYNISILVVDGVGFKPYIKICRALDIPFAMRTDNDIFEKTVKKIEYYYYAGISRVVGIYKELISSSSDDLILKYWDNNNKKNQWLKTRNVTKGAQTLNKAIRKKLEKFNIYLSDVDLENDIVNTKLYDSLSSYYETTKKQEIIKLMQSKKAEHMLGYLMYLIDNNISMNIIENDNICKPLKELKELVSKGVSSNE